MSQFFVETPLAAVTALSHLGYVSISFAHQDLGIFRPFFIAIFLKLCYVSLGALVNSNLYVFPQTFNGIQVWALA